MRSGPASGPAAAEAFLPRATWIGGRPVRLRCWPRAPAAGGASTPPGLPARARCGPPPERRGAADRAPTADQLPLAGGRSPSTCVFFEPDAATGNPAPATRSLRRPRRAAARRGACLLFQQPWVRIRWRELRAAACAAVLPDAHPMPFVDMHDLGDMMVAGRFFVGRSWRRRRYGLTYGLGPPSCWPRCAPPRRAIPRDDRQPGLPSGRPGQGPCWPPWEAQRDSDGRIAPDVRRSANGLGWKAPPRRARRAARPTICGRDACGGQLRRR